MGELAESREILGQELDLERHAGLGRARFTGRFDVAAVEDDVRRRAGQCFEESVHAVVACASVGSDPRAPATGRKLERFPDGKLFGADGAPQRLLRRHRPVFVGWLAIEVLDHHEGVSGWQRPIEAHTRFADGVQGDAATDALAVVDHGTDPA